MLFGHIVEVHTLAVRKETNPAGAPSTLLIMALLTELIPTGYLKMRNRRLTRRSYLFSGIDFSSHFTASNFKINSYWPVVEIAPSLSKFRSGELLLIFVQYFLISLLFEQFFSSLSLHVG